MKDTLTLIIYTRKASVEQAEAPYNITGLEALVIKDYNELMGGGEDTYTVNTVLYQDLGYSGLDKKRPALESMLKRLDEGGVTALAVPNIQQLARSWDHLAELMELIVKSSTLLFYSSIPFYAEETA